LSEETNNTTDLGVPYSLTLDKWKFMVKLLAQRVIKDGSTTVDFLSTLSAISPTIISANQKFLKTLHIITKDSKGSELKCTEKGLSYGKALIDQDDAKQKEILSDLAKTHFTTLLEFYQVHMESNSLDFEKLFNQIKFLSDIKDIQGHTRNTDSNYARGIYTLIEILIEAGLLDDSFHPQKNKPPQSSEARTVSRKWLEIPTASQASWVNKLFSKIEKLHPDKIDKNWITANIVASHHEGSVLKIAHFLGICDEDGNKAENYEKLRYFSGENFKKELEDILKEKYPKILATIDLETAQHKNLAELFMRVYDIGEDKTNKAIDVFLQLCKFSSLNISDDLIKTPKIETKTNRETKTIQKTNVSPIIQPSITNPTLTNTNLNNAAVNVNIKIEIDATNEKAFENTLNFIVELKKKIQINKIEVNPEFD